jgi:hypothetical protein
VARRTTRYVVNQYRVNGEDRRKQNAVGHQVDPEAVDLHLAGVMVTMVVLVVMTVVVTLRAIKY